MFDSEMLSSGFPAGEAADFLSAWSDPNFEERVLLITLDEWNTGWVDEEQHFLPDLESIPAGRFLFAVLDSVDRSRLNGFDLVRLLQARERLVSHSQAEGMADAVEVSYASPGDASSPPRRDEFPSEYAADEIRAALCLTRRAAEYRMSFALDLCERLPRLWEMFSDGVLDLARVRVVSDGTAHLHLVEAGRIVDVVAEKAPLMTTGELAAWIRRLCVEVDPAQAEKREEQARAERRLVIEPTVDGTANVHLYDIAISDARAVGKRVNAHMISLRRDGDTRSHDNLRADIAIDLMLGGEAKTGRGLVDIRVDLATLAGLDEKAAEIPGMGPVVAEVARRVVDSQHQTEWRTVITDPEGRVVDMITNRRRPTKAISRMVDAIHPVCTFPGCRTPASDCDYDHHLPWSRGGQTSATNLGPKCRHDHQLKDHGWTHQTTNSQDTWTSPLGHTYITQGQSP